MDYDRARSRNLRDAQSDQARAQVAAEIETYALVSAQLLRQQLSYPSGTDSQQLPRH